jgi:hypothetical protein
MEGTRQAFSSIIVRRENHGLRVFFRERVGGDACPATEFAELVFDVKRSVLVPPLQVLTVFSTHKQ